MATVRHFGFVGKFWDDPQREFDGLYHCAKCGLNLVSRFDSTKVRIFCAFSLKMPIAAPFWQFLG